MLTIRETKPEDHDAIWTMLEPVLRGGEVFALPATMNQDAALAYWFDTAHTVFVAEHEGVIAGSYYLQANQQGGGAHVANCGYLTANAVRGRGVARAMCEHSLALAKSLGYRAMQFNFVVSSNYPAVHLWQKCGFRILGRLPDAFQHPTLGLVDAFVMWCDL